jgi:hypothetical protein
VNFAGVEKYALGGGGFAGINMRDNTDIPDFLNDDFSHRF